MKAKIVGMKKLDFQGNEGPVKITMYYLNMRSENVECYETNVTSHNELRNGPPPPIKIGDEIDVEYNKNGKLRLS